MDLSDLTKHYNSPGGEAFDVTPEAALDYFTAKGIKPTFNWQEMIGQEHAQAFTIAKMLDVDLLKDVRESLDLAIATGTPFDVWADEIIPLMQKKGWWGKKHVTDAAGNVVEAQLGSPHRLRTIFRTNLQAAYAVGQWQMIEDQAEDAPYLLYDALDDHRTRPEHAAWDGRVLPITSDWWKSHTPPNGWNCRCSVIQLDEDDLDQLGLQADRRPPPTEFYNWVNPHTGKTHKVPVGVDPGFGQAASSRLSKLQELLRQKASNLPSDMIPAAEAGLQALAVATETATQQALKDLASDIGQSRLARGKEKVAQTAAEIELQNAQASKVPYLAKAIKDLLKSDKADGMKPTEILAAAKAKAAKQKQSAMLHDFKKKYLAGQKPSAKQQAAFDDLPYEAQLSLLQDLDQQLEAAKAAQAAKEKLQAAIEASPGSAVGKAVKKLQQANQWTPDDNPVSLAALLDDTVEQVKAEKATTDALSAYKKNAIAGKVPSAKQKQAFEAQDPEKQQKLLDEIEAAKAKAAADAAPDPEKVPEAPVAAAAEEIDVDNLVQVGPQKGSNPGGLYVDNTTGEKWYIKLPSSADIARNEVLAAKLYEAGGVEVPDLRLINFKGQTAIASRIVDGLEKGSPADLAKAGGSTEAFAFDAWLANWDVVGLGYDNLLLKGRRAVRVDTGGALRYRAQGGLKGSSWGKEVLEIDSLRDPRTNAQSASVYGKMSKADIEASVRRVLAMDDDAIRDLVRRFGPVDDVANRELVDTLLARKQDLWDRYPAARPLRDPDPVPIANAGDRVSPTEYRSVVDSRVNGFSFKTDKDQIEDHNVLVSQYDETGKSPGLTRGSMKLTEKGAKELEQRIEQVAGGQITVADPTAASAKILELIKGVNSRAAKGEALEQKNIDRFVEVETLVGKAVTDLKKARKQDGVDVKVIDSQIDYLEEWQANIRQSVAGLSPTDTARAIPGQFDLQFLKPIVQTVDAKSDGLPWVKQQGWSFRVAQFERGKAKLTQKRQQAPGVRETYVAELDGVRVEYVPFRGNDSARAFQGTVQIDVSGATPEAAAKVFETLERMGLNSARATDLDRRELYLNKVARMHSLKDRKLEQKYVSLEFVEDQADRVQQKLDLMNKHLGMKIEKSDGFSTYDGLHQAFGHGRAHTMRPDLEGADFRQFVDEHVIYHNPTGLGLSASTGMLERMKIIIEGGGMLISAAERIRRGVSATNGTSITEDVRTGGGNYVFTRLKRAPRGNRHRGAGLYWSPNNLKRTDAISYGGDKFGNTTDQVQRSDRRVTVDQLKAAAKNGSNETIFKDGLSLFDQLERVVMPSPNQARELIEWMRDQGYEKWPDGRDLEEVITS